MVEPENNEQPEVDETKNSSNITQEDIDKAKKISDELKRNRYGVKTEFGEYNKTGNKIEEITCQTQLGIYMIKRADGSMQFFNAKGHGAIDKKSAEKIAEKFPNFSKKDLRNVDLNILKILQHEGFDDKQIEEYINGKQSKENKFTIIYKDDMNYDDYKDSLEETENLIAKEEKESKKPKYEIDEKSKLSELDKKEKKFLKKLARKQANREDTHIKYDYRTLGQKILDFFERRTLLNEGYNYTQTDIDDTNRYNKDQRLAKEEVKSKLEKGINSRIYNPETPSFNEAKRNFEANIKVETKPTQKAKPDADLDAKIATAFKEAGIENPDTEKGEDR